MTITTPLRWPVVIIGGLLLATGSGLLAAWAQTGGWDTLRFVVFGLCLVAPYVGLLTILTAPPDSERLPEHHEESVENAWLQKALASTTLDLFIVLGVLTAVTSILGFDEPGTGLVLVFLMADVTVRYVVLSRREA